MKKEFDQPGYRLSEAEKLAIWRRVSLTRRQPRRRRLLVPAVATTAVTAAGLLFVLLLVDRQPEVVPRPAELAQADQITQKQQPEAEERSLKLEPEPESYAAGPAEPGSEPAVVSPAKARRDPVAAEEPPLVALRAAPEQVVPAPAPGSIQGRVLDAETGEALPYADVLVRGAADSLVAIWSGSFVLANLEADRSYSLRVTHLGFAPAETTVSVAAGETVNLAFALEPRIVATLGTVEVEGEKGTVDIISATAEQKIGQDRFQRYSIDSAEDAIARQKGIVMRAGELHVRGGRSGERKLSVSDPAAGGAAEEPTWGGLSPLFETEPGGDLPKDRCLPRPGKVWVPPNDQAYDTMYFEHYGVNPFIVTEEDALSTFAIDVDNASYTVFRRYLRDGNLPPREAVRVEEYVNFFAQDYGPQPEEDFGIFADGAPSPFGQGYNLLRVGVLGRTVAPEKRKPAHLVFVIDVSGSMNRENRLGLVKKALLILLDELQKGDTVGLVVYGTRGRVILEPTSVADRGRLEEAIQSLSPGGSTNADEGLDLGYRMARDNYQAGAINRLILCSDGVANQARTGADSILDHVRRESDRGIHLSTIGFGMGNYNDVLLEKLANRGDGNYYYVDELREAERVFRENLTGTLQTIARDVKIQVEFNPEHVLRYRLLGYENRDVADQDFRDDSVDAGEIGAGHQVTALYEVKLSDEARRSLGQVGKTSRKSPLLATIRLRYELPAHSLAAGQVIETELAVQAAALGGSFGEAAARFRLAAVVAEFAEILRGSYWARGSDLAGLIPMADHLAAELTADPAVGEFSRLVRRAADLTAARPQD